MALLVTNPMVPTLVLWNMACSCIVMMMLCVCVLLCYSFPSLSWQLLVQLYHANERVMFAVDQPATLSMAALDLNLPSKVRTHKLCMGCLAVLVLVVWQILLSDSQP